MYTVTVWYNVFYIHQYQQSWSGLLIPKHVRCQTSKFAFEHLYLLLARSFESVKNFTFI